MIVKVTEKANYKIYFNEWEGNKNGESISLKNNNHWIKNSPKHSDYCQPKSQEPPRPISRPF